METIQFILKEKGISIISIDQHLTVTHISSSFQQITGLNPNSYFNKKIEKLIPNICETWFQEKKKLTKNLIRINGSDDFYNITICPGQMNDKNNIIILEINSSNNQNNLLFQLIDQSPIMHAIIDTTLSKVLYANQELKKNIGIKNDKKEIFVKDIHSPREIEWLKENMMPSLIKNKQWRGNKVATFPETILEPLPVYSQCQLLDSRTENPLMLCTMMNLKEIKDNEKKINKQEQEIKLFKDLQNQSNNIFIIIEIPSENIIYINDSSKELLEIDKKNKLTIKDLYSKGEMNFFQKNIFSQAKREGSWSGRHSITTHSQKKIPVFGTVSYIESNLTSKKYLCATFIDITKQLSQEHEKIASQEQFERILRLSVESEISSSIAHQITQPLSVISSTLQNWNLFKKTPNREEIEKIIETTLGMGETIHQIKNLLTNKSIGKVSLINISNFIENIKKDYIERNINLKIKIINDIPKKTVILYNKILLNLSIRNLITNAIESVETHKKPIVYCCLTKNKNKIEIRICDNGPGVNKSLQKKIFEPFYSTKENGTGIGLSLLMHLSKNLSTNIFYDNNWKNINSDLTGACFCLSIPEAKQETL